MLVSQRDKAKNTVSDSKGELLLAPSTRDGVQVAAADAAGLDLDVDVVVAKGLGVKLVLVELIPRLGAVDLEARELVGIRHCSGGEMSDGIVGRRRRNEEQKERDTGIRK